MLNSCNMDNEHEEKNEPSWRNPATSLDECGFDDGAVISSQVTE